MILYRPVGLAELELIAESGFTAFPPRLEHQPIFYPVLTVDYAMEIACYWNPTDAASGYLGAVTSFEVDDAWVARYEVHTVGARRHAELWVPAEELDAFNAHLIGPIRIEAVTHGAEFEGEIDEESGLPVSIARALAEIAGATSR